MLPEVRHHVLDAVAPVQPVVADELEQLTKSMAETWGERGITANAIAPGYFETELTAAVFADNKRASTLANSTALGRNGKLDDLVGAAVFLASGASDYITGQTLYVDGGFTAMGLPRGATDNNNSTKSKL